MRLYIGVTDGDWHRFLSQRPEIDEVNFWQPSGSRQFRSLEPGDIFLFKLHHPENFIVGGGVFTHFTICPVQLAWEAFGEKNGVGTLAGMRARIERYRRVPANPRENYAIGCILLRDPFFFARDLWIQTPADFARNIVQGKRYDATTSTGRAVWDEVRSRLHALPEPHRIGEPRRVEGPMWGEGYVSRRRLGQGTFCMMVTDTYERRCAVTREKALPVLQAAHIRPVAEDGEHRLDNGLLLRSDIHKLFDDGYVTITPEHEFRVSRRLKTDFDNGEHYYQLNRSPIWLPPRSEDRPNREFLEYHGDVKFLGD